MRLRRLVLWAAAIAASWLAAIAALTAVLPLLPVSAGNQPDHLE